MCKTKEVIKGVNLQSVIFCFCFEHVPKRGEWAPLETHTVPGSGACQGLCVGREGSRQVLTKMRATSKW